MLIKFHINKRSVPVKHHTSFEPRRKRPTRRQVEMRNTQPESAPTISVFLNLLLVMVLFVSIFGNVLLYTDLQFEQTMNRILTTRVKLAESRAEFTEVIYQEMLIAERWENAIEDWDHNYDPFISYFKCGFSDYAPLYHEGKTYCFRGNWKISRLIPINRASEESGIDYLTTPPTYDEPGYRAVWIEDVGDLSDFWDITGIFR